mgnify:CR=1 FL=1
MPHDDRAIVGAAQRQVGIRHQPRQVVLDPQRRRHQELQVELQRQRRRLGGRSAAGAAGGGAPRRQIEDAARRVDAPAPDRALDGDDAAERRRLDAAAQRQVGIDHRADAFRDAQVHVLAARRDVERRGQVALEPDPAAELHAPAAERRRHIVEPDAAGIEMDGPVDGVEGVREPRSGAPARR